jgi:hypothetical protein
MALRCSNHLEGRGGYEIVERDDGFFYPGAGPELYFAPFVHWRAHEKAAMRFVRGHILDVGCGAGRVCLYLQVEASESWDSISRLGP